MVTLPTPTDKELARATLGAAQTRRRRGEEAEQHNLSAGLNWDEPQVVSPTELRVKMPPAQPVGRQPPSPEYIDATRGKIPSLAGPALNIGANMLPGGGFADAVVGTPVDPFDAESGRMKTLSQNLFDKDGSLVEASLQGLGVMADGMLAAAPMMGAASPFVAVGGIALGGATDYAQMWRRGHATAADALMAARKKGVVSQMTDVLRRQGVYDDFLAEAKLNHDEIAEGLTPGFKKWFEGSAAVDDAGKPAVFYHGTSKDADFNKFKIGQRGAFFTKDPQAASSYALENDSMNFKYEDGGYRKTNTASRVMPVYISAKNPYVMTDADMASYSRVENYAKWQRDFANVKRSQGFDSVVYPDGSWVAFDPKQIKSAIGNNGAFDPNDPRIDHLLRNVTQRAADGRPMQTQPLAIGSEGRLIDEMMRRGLIKMSEPAPGIRVFHGSPHDFDKFSMDKIGTGEGAQAYGHGLYFAENEGVASAYRSKLSKGFHDGMISIDGEPQFVAPGGGGARPDIVRRLAKEMRLYATDNPGRDLVADGFLDETLDNIGRAMRADDEGLSFISDLKKRNIQFNPDGALYETRINASPDEFLDWDKPLSEQPAKVQEALQKTMRPSAWAEFKGALGGTAIKNGFIDFDPKQGASEKLRAAGVKGIRYKDAGSRASQGAGTSNYVVFDDAIIEIIKKYGMDHLLRDITKRGISGRRIATAPLAIGTEQKLMDAILSKSRTTFAGQPITVHPDGRKTITQYKIFNLKDGQLYPAMVTGAPPIETGKWLDAQPYPTKGLADRFGWHSSPLPMAKQLRGIKSGLRQPNRVWAEVEVDVTSQITPPSAKGVRGEVPTGAYTYNNQKDVWVISPRIRVTKVLSDDEVAGVLRQAGKDADALAETRQIARGGVSDDARRVLELRAQQMELPIKQRVQPSGEKFFDTSTEAYTDPKWMPEQTETYVPRAPEGKKLPLGDRARVLIDRKEEIAQKIAERTKPFLGTPAQFFYHTGPIRKKAVELGFSRKHADDWLKEYAKALAATSPRTTTDFNTRNASLVMMKENAGMLPSQPVTRVPGALNDKGYPMMVGPSGIHAKLIDEVYRGEGFNPDVNPKPATFAENNYGNLEGVTADTHAIRGALDALNEIEPGAIPEQFIVKEYRDAYRADPTKLDASKWIDDTLGSQAVNKKNSQVEYAPFVDIYKRVSDIHGVRPAEGQSLGWFGAGARTGLGSELKTLADLLSDRISVTAKLTGWSSDEVFKKLLRREIPMAAIVGIVGADAAVKTLAEEE
jgi:hypothetical protein